MSQARTTDGLLYIGLFGCSPNGDKKGRWVEFVCVCPGGGGGLNANEIFVQFKMVNGRMQKFNRLVEGTPIIFHPPSHTNTH